MSLKLRPEPDLTGAAKSETWTLPEATILLDFIQHCSSWCKKNPLSTEHCEPNIQTLSRDIWLSQRDHENFLNKFDFKITKPELEGQVKQQNSDMGIEHRHHKCLPHRLTADSEFILLLKCYIINLIDSILKGFFSVLYN